MHLRLADKEKQETKIAEEATLGNKDAIAQFKADMAKPETDSENNSEGEKMIFHFRKGN